MRGQRPRPYWNIASHQAIQHVEALPDIYSSSWEYGGITILERDEDEDFRLPMFIAMDRPQHTDQRRTVAPAFTAGRDDAPVRRHPGTHRRSPRWLAVG